MEKNIWMDIRFISCDIGPKQDFADVKKRRISSKLEPENLYWKKLKFTKTFIA